MCGKYWSRRECLERSKLDEIRFFGALATSGRARMIQNTEFLLVQVLRK
jgi:hypothetical protein